MSLAQNPQPGLSGGVPLQGVAVDRPAVGAPEDPEAAGRILARRSAPVRPWR